MAACLSAMSADELPVAGTVVDGDVHYVAAYYLDAEQQPPVIHQLLQAVGKNTLALTRIAVANDEPQTSVQGFTIHEERSIDNCLTLIMGAEDGALGELRHGPGSIDTFDCAYAYVEGFEPNA